jgi:lipid-binding SYLF domain-containing protein
VVPSFPALADDYDDTIKVFRNAGASARIFDKSYGYAVSPTIGKGGLVVGGAHGAERVYEKGRHIGDSTMTQLTIGLQLGGQAYSQTIFFEDKRAFDEFTSGNFAFGAQATAVAITSEAQAQASTAGREGRADGRSDRRRPEVRLQEEVATRELYCAESSSTKRSSASKSASRG